MSKMKDVFNAQCTASEAELSDTNDIVLTTEMELDLLKTAFSVKQSLCNDLLADNKRLTTLVFMYKSEVQKLNRKIFNSHNTIKKLRGQLSYLKEKRIEDK